MITEIHVTGDELNALNKKVGGIHMPKPMTNEEWFDGLSTKEKAKVFANATYSTAETPLTILWGGKEAEQKKWEMWLKQPHTTRS